MIEQHFPIALTLFTISSATDLLDGYIARRFNQKTKIGSLLDPIADKFLMATLTLTLTYVQLIPIWLTALIITRDSLILSGGLYIRYKTLSAPKSLKSFLDFSSFKSSDFVPTFVSKVNTGFQFSFIVYTLLASVFGFSGHSTVTVMQVMTAITTLVSGLDYLKRLKV